MSSPDRVRRTATLAVAPSPEDGSRIEVFQPVRLQKATDEVCIAVLDALRGAQLLLVQAIEAQGGRAVARSLDARQEHDIAAFLREADAEAPLEVCIFNIGANVHFSLVDTTERVFRKVWEMACYAGFLAGREAARLMLPHGNGAIFFTGATASLRGGAGYAAFAAAKAGLRAVAQSAARELGPKNIHVAHLVIDAGVDTAFVRERIRERGGDEAVASIKPDQLMNPDSVAKLYWDLHTQSRDAWTFELDARPYGETW